MINEKIKSAKKLLVEIYFQSLPDDRSKNLCILVDLIDNLIEDPEDVAFVPTDEQRKTYTSRLKGIEFTATHRGFPAKFIVTDNGSFQTPLGESFDAPTPALQSQWKDSMTNKELSFNGWGASDKNGRKLNDYIKEFVIKG
jgi:hypothetical protein